MTKIKKQCCICGSEVEHYYSFWNEVGGNTQKLKTMLNKEQHDFIWICNYCEDEFGWRISQSILDKITKRLNEESKCQK